MPLLTRVDLLEAGWREGPHLDGLLDEVARLEGKGIRDLGYIWKRLERLSPRLGDPLVMRETALPFAEAIEVCSREEEKNLKAVRRTMRELMGCPVVTGGAIMPDACPAGSAVASIPVGGAVVASQAILPGAHGSDICCSMHASFFPMPVDLPVGEMLRRLMCVTRFGPGGRPMDEWVEHPVLAEPVWENPFLRGLTSYAQRHLADQGDGNHFAFLGEWRPEADTLARLGSAGYAEETHALRAGDSLGVLVTHHGSRGLGAQLYSRALSAAVRLTKERARGIPDAAAWIPYDTPEGVAYWEALEYTARWTRANHELIHKGFLEEIASSSPWSFGNPHNFVWKRGEAFYHGKGATPAWRDERGRPLLGLIPMNMASPILIVLGKDNPDYLSFCPHGAGRNQSRRAILRQFRLKDGSLDEEAMRKALAESTRDIDVRWYQGLPDLSESPLGYKTPAMVREQIERFGLADVVGEIHPLGSIMAGNAGRRREEVLTPKQLRQMEHRAERRRERQSLRDVDGFGD